MRRLIDVTMPNKPVCNDTRGDRRFNRSLPLVVTPSVRGKPDIKNSLMALTQDFSDRGIALVALEPLQGEEYFVSVWPTMGDFEEPIHLKCLLANCRNIAHGFWTCGFAIDNVMNLEHMNDMLPLTKVCGNALRPNGTEAEASS